MQPSPPRRRPARPLGDVPVGSLAGRGEDLAKGWLIALIEQAPLEDAATLVSASGSFARVAPRVCEALVRGLADDDGLRRIAPLVSCVGELVGARDGAAAMRSVDALQAVIWSALRAELGGADGELVAAVAERWALVGEVARAAVVRDARSSAERWPAALEGEVARSARTGAPLSLLLIELADVERLVAASPAGEAAAIFDRFARAVREALRAQDILVREGDGRVWAIAGDTGRADASALASRISDAVRSLPSWRGAPLAAEIGVAVLGEDGADAAEMIEAAEVAKFAAQASGIEVSRARPEDRTPPVSS